MATGQFTWLELPKDVPGLQGLVLPSDLSGLQCLKLPQDMACLHGLALLLEVPNLQ